MQPSSGRSQTGYPGRTPKRSLTALRPVVEPTIRRVRDVRVPDRRSFRTSFGCLRGERLLAYSHAVAFRSNRPLALSALGSVRGRSRAAGRSVAVTVTSGIERPAGMRVEVQVHAICIRGPS
jgi:hypothetical protein